MGYEWDPIKSKSNYLKHGIYFADAVAVFQDDQSITIEDEHPEEKRFIEVGMGPFGKIIVTVYTYRGESIRIISARKATPNECKQYGEKR